MRSLLIFAAVAVFTAAPHADQRPPQERPRIDPLSASIAGRVVAADSGAPIRRAEVRAMSTSSISRLTTTDADGRYELRNLPAGEYRVTVSRSGFVTLGYGQRRPSEASAVITLAEGQRVAANLALPRGGAITGRVLDDAGEPVADVRVQAMRARLVEGRRRVEQVGVTDTTDDRGAFRLYGLEPGDYFVAALVRTPTPENASMSVFTGTPRGDVLATVPVFHPGAPAIDQAQPITLGLAAEARADIFLAPLRSATVSGVVLDSTGGGASDAEIQLVAALFEGPPVGVSAGVPPLRLSAHAEPDGSFAIPNVPPGTYTLVARAQSERVRGLLDGLNVPTPEPATKERIQQVQQLMLNGQELAILPLTVNNADVAGLTLTTSPGGVVTATYVADSGVTAPLPRDLELQTVGGIPAMTNHFTSADGSQRVQLSGVIGPTRLRVANLPDGWAVKALMVDGDDVTDQAINVKGGTTAVRVVLTTRVTEVSGTVASGANHYVVLFAEDASKWTFPSRFVRAERADAQGAFRITRLPGNERYLAVAVDALDDGEVTDPSFLERMRSRGVPFSLGDGERRALDLRPTQR